jgi:hypothetical protein
MFIITSSLKAHILSDEDETYYYAKCGFKKRRMFVELAEKSSKDVCKHCLKG